MAKTFVELHAMIANGNPQSAKAIQEAILDKVEEVSGEEDGTLYEVKTNKQTDLTPSATKYPTVNAVIAAIAAGTYKEYVALLTQTGTAAPVATILKNTLGSVPVWTRDSSGNYLLTLASAFNTAKTTVLLSKRNASIIVTGYALTANEILVSSYVDAAPLFTLADDAITNIAIHIRVYP